MILDMFMNESNLFDQKFQNEASELDDVTPIALSESEDIMDACFRITLENETNWNTIMNTIALSEMAFLESHAEGEVMYEAADFKAIVNSVIAWIKKQWAKLAGIFQKAITMIGEKMDSNKRLIAAFEKKVKTNKDLNEVKVTLDKKILKSVTPVVTMPDNVQASFGKVYAKLTRFQDFTNKEACDQMVADFSGENQSKKEEEFYKLLGFSSKSKISSELKDKWFESKKTLRAVDACEELRKQYKTIIKKQHDVTKATFNGFIADCKKNAPNKDTDTYERGVTVLNLQTRAIKNAISVLNITTGVSINAINTHMSYCRAVVSKALKGKGDAPEKKETKNESADLICNLI